MYVMARCSVKQSQNIIRKVKIKKQGIGKKNTGKMLNEIYLIAFILSVRQLLVWFYLHQEKLFTKPVMNLVLTLTNYNYLV